MASAVANGEDIFGKADGSDAQKAAASSTKKSLRLLVSHCRDGYSAARERERAGPRAPHEGVDPTTRALWRKEPAQQVKRMVAVAEKMYNCDMVLASQADPSTIVSIYLDLLGRWGVEAAVAALRICMGIAERYLHREREAQRPKRDSRTAVRLGRFGGRSAFAPHRSSVVLDRGGTGMSGGMRRQLNQWQAGDARKVSKRW